MKVTVILIVVGAFETAPKNLKKRFDELKTRGRMETLQTTVFWNRVGIFILTLTPALLDGFPNLL